FRDKARAFLRQHLNHIAVQKVRLNRPLTATDLAELERMLVESGVGDAEDVRQAAERSQGLGLFVRSLVGLDRAAAKEALAKFTAGRTLTADQLEFVNLVVDHLTELGIVEPERLYGAPFTDLTPRGPEGLFQDADVNELLRVLDEVRATALAA
ncbi:MAG: restriction endonuclease subunit R, partial [Burkholderiales bacterium]|nr:restriction endonuclease subunit R [Burkholderiales bacterium]